MPSPADTGRMAEPSYWQTVPSGEVWDPLANLTPRGAGDFVLLADEYEPGGGGSWSRDDASITLVGHVPWKKRYDARRKCLGYAWADTATPWELHRVNPIPHPDERQLRCVSCDIVGFNPDGVDQGSGNTGFGVAAPYLDPAPPAGTILLPHSPTYTRGHATLKFRPHPYTFLSDAEMTSLAAPPYPTRLPEFYRNTAVFETCDPVLDVLLADTQPFLEWAEGEAGGPTSGQAIPSQTPEYIQRATLVMAWFHVPLDFIANPYLPSKIMSCVGATNDEANWLQVFPKGSMRLEAPRFRKYTQPHIRTDPAQPLTNTYVVDVFLPFTWIDPTPGLGSPVFRGWNLFPFGPNGKYYSVKRTNSGGTPLPYFPFKKFDAMFTHVGDTSVMP
jgi:hypothetical protein